jgi:hypothetical protein
MTNNTSQPLLPGEDLIEKGLQDLAKGLTTEHSLLLLVAGPRLRPLGVPIPTVATSRPFEHQLYDLLSVQFGDATHSHYNSLLRRIGSYAHALEREQSATRAV